MSFCQDKSSLYLMLLTRAHHATYSFISNNSKKNSDKWAQKIGCDKKPKSNDFIHASEKKSNSKYLYFICLDIHIWYISRIIPLSRYCITFHFIHNHR